MKLVVLGGAGFIGSHIVDRLLKDGHSIRIFDRPFVQKYREFNLNEKVEWYYGDITSRSNIREAIDGTDAVIHLISTTLPKSSNEDPVFDIESNLIGSINILESMVLLKVPKIIFISSGGTVYGKSNSVPIKESHSTNPIVSYGVIKLAIEKYLYLYENLHNIKTVSLRVSNPYGERQKIENAQGAIGVFLDKAIKRNTIEIWGDGSIIRDYIYIQDVAEAFAKAIEYTGNLSVFNIASGVGVSLLEIIYTIEDILEIKLERNYKAGRTIDIPINILCNQLALKELGWKPKFSLIDGISETIKLSSY